MVKKILPTLIFEQRENPAAEIQKIGSYGAEGIEIRRERLSGKIADILPELESCIAKAGMQTVIYSVPEELWQADSVLNVQLETYIAEAEAAGASHLKLSLGEFSEKKAMKENLEKIIKKTAVRLLVENGQQKLPGGVLSAFATFFRWKQALEIKMTFDTGNWLVVGESAEEAFCVLQKEISYMHVKDVRKSSGGMESIAVDKKSPWLAKAADCPMAAIEFPLEAPDTEARWWLEQIKEEV